MAQPRVAGRLGDQIDLNVTFYKNGQPADPYAIRKVEVYKSAVQPENLLAEFPVVEPSDSNYPAPIDREQDSQGDPRPGVYHLYWDVPSSGIPVPDIFFDVWHFIPNDPVGTGSEGTEDLDDESLWQSCCNTFWLVNEDTFYCDDELYNVRFGFEPLDIKFQQPEIRTLEIGLQPLPLYDYDYNKIAPMIPHMSAFFSLATDSCELLIDQQPMRIGLRQGTYRSNPFTLQYTFDTRTVLKGSYQYWVTLCLPNGESRTSPRFALQVS
jgi:hypothetical protein